MDIFLKGGRQVRLGQENLLGQGGEGVVYGKDGQAFKIYHDPARSLVPDKLAELARIADARVIAPTDLLYDSTMRVVGYQMRLVERGVTICEAMTRAYRARRGLGQDAYHPHVEDLRQALDRVHAAGVVLVDLNDLNVLLVQDGVRILDLDSAQTPSFRATAIQAGIRDPLANGARFEVGADWYAFAILAFELFCGAHPFRGSHPDASTMVDRMRLGLSALDARARLPAAAYPVSGIPASYRGWLEAVLSNQTREAPRVRPSLAAVIVAPAARPAAGRRLVAELVAKYPKPVLRAWGRGRYLVVVVEGGDLYYNSRLTRFTRPRGADLAVGYAHEDDERAFACYVNADGEVKVYDLLEDREVPCSMRADEISSVGRRVLLRQGSSVYELSFWPGKQTVAVGTKKIANCLAYGMAKLGQGALVQVMLQTLVLTLMSEFGSAREVRIPELKGYRPLQVWGTPAVGVLRVAKNCRIDRVVVSLRQDGSYDLRVTEDCPDDLDLARTMSGIVADRRDDEVLMWGEEDPGRVVSAQMPEDDYGMLFEHMGAVYASHGCEIVRIRS